MAGAPGVELATAYVSIVSSAGGLGESITRGAQEGAAGADAAGASAGSRFSGAFKGALAIGAAAAGGVAAGVAALYKVGSTFDDVADTIRVGTGKSGAALDGLVGIAKTVGTEVPASFDQIGPTITQLNQRLGLSGDTLKTVAEQYLQAGHILGQDVDIQSTTAAFSAFGIKGADVSTAMDQLFRVSQATGVSMNDLASQVQTSGAALKTLGFSFADSAALAGSLNKAGLNSPAILASMSKGLVTLAKAGEDPAAAFKRVTGEIGGFVKAGDTAGALNLASKVFGTKGATQLVGAIQSGTLALGDLTGAAGVTGDTILGLGSQTADFAEHWQVFKNKILVGLEPVATKVFGLIGSAMDGVSNKIGPFIDKVSASVSGLIAKVTPMAGAVSDLFRALFSTVNQDSLHFFDTDSPPIEGMRTLKRVVTDAFAAVQPLLAQIGPMFQQLAPAIGSILPLLNPLGLIFKDVLLPVLPQIVPLIAQLGSAIADGLGQILPALIPVAVAIVQALASLIPVAMQLLQAVIPPLTEVLRTVAPVIVEIIAAMVPLIAQIAGEVIPIIQALLPVVTTVFQALVPIIEGALTVVRGIIQTVTSLIKGDWSGVWEGIKTILTGAWEAVKGIISGAISVVKSILSAGWGLIKDDVAGAWEWVRSKIVGAVQAAIDWVTSKLTAFKDWVKGIWNGIVGIFSAPIQAEVQGNVNLGYAASSGTIPFGGAATGAYVPARPGGTPFVVGEGGKPEIIAPIDMLRQTISEALDSRGSAGGAGGTKLADHLEIHTADPDVMTALNRALFKMPRAVA